MTIEQRLAALERRLTELEQRLGPAPGQPWMPTPAVIPSIGAACFICGMPPTGICTNVTCPFKSVITATGGGPNG